MHNQFMNSFLSFADENSSSLDLQSSRDSIDTLRNVSIKTEPLKNEGFQSVDEQRVLDLKYSAPLQPHQRSLSMNRVSNYYLDIPTRSLLCCVDVSFHMELMSWWNWIVTEISTVTVQFALNKCSNNDQPLSSNCKATASLTSFHSSRIKEICGQSVR